MVVMDAVDLERVGDNIGDIIKTLTTHHMVETARMVALTTGSKDLHVCVEGGGGLGAGERERERIAHCSAYYES